MMDPELRRQLIAHADRIAAHEEEGRRLHARMCATVVAARDDGASLREVAELLDISTLQVAEAESRGRLAVTNPR